MNTFDFEIMYKKGSEMPADYLSRNLVSAISWDSAELLQAQTADPLIKALKNFFSKPKVETKISANKKAKRSDTYR